MSVGVVAAPFTASTTTLFDIGANYEWLMTVKAPDGAQNRLYAFYPPDWSEGDSRTAVVFIHGGGWRAGAPSYFFPHCQYFAGRGAVAFSVKYRLVESEGMEAIGEIGRCLTDCRAAIRYIRDNAEHFGIDPGRIVVIGDSAGGHLAAALAVIEDPADADTTDSMANAAVCYNPVADLDVELLANMFKIDMEDPTVMEALDTVSPAAHAAPGKAPMLIMHGDADTVVPIESVKAFAEALATEGNRCEMITLEGVKHAFTIVNIGTEETIVRSLMEADAFIGSLGWLEGEPTIEMSGEYVGR
jgi:acetyl esterase/lipase